MIKQDVNINIRVSSKLRDRFIEICQQQGLSYSKILRHMMKKYIADRMNDEDFK